MRTEKVANKINIALLSSGDGSISESIIQYFEDYLDVDVTCLITNNKKAGVLNRIRRYKVPTFVTDQYKEIDKILTEHEVHYIILANYLNKIPPNFCKKYKWRMINIHPSLLPKYGGKDMYGDNVHKSILSANEEETGITIHFVDEIYNNGDIIFQKSIKIDEIDTIETIESKIKTLEQRYYPLMIEKTIKRTFASLFKND